MTIERVCVIGMGTMGSQIGIVSARAGFQTFMVDTSKNQIEKGLASIRSFLKGQEKKGKMEREATEKVLSLIHMGKDLGEASADADMVIEAVYEDIETKKEVFRSMDKAGPKESILASNTSTLWISEIAAATKRP